MTSAGGHWVRVRFSDASSRLDWIPEHQPPAPDSGPGAWHVVPDPAGGPSRWEWHPGSSPLLVAISATEQAAPPPADRHETQPLPLQVVPNRPKRGAAVLSVHPQPKFARPALPRLRMRWAAWSLSAVLAVPVVYLLADNGDTDGHAMAAGDTGEGDTDEAGIDEGDTVTGLPGVDPTSTAPDAATPATGTAPSEAAIDRYLRHLVGLDTAQGYTFGSLGEQYLLTSGTEACEALDRGVSYEAVRESGMTRIPNGGQLVVASAATYLCPRHHAELQAFTADSESATAQGADTPADTAVG